MTETVLTAGVLMFLIAAALLTVTSDKMFHAVVYAGALSTAAALIYVLLGAPDVALAEVVIGSTLSTILYLVTLKKYRVFTIYCRKGAGDAELFGRLLHLVEKALAEQTIEPHVIESTQALTDIMKRPDSDLVVESARDGITLHAEQYSQYMEVIMNKLEKAGMADLVCFQDSAEEHSDI